MEVRRADRGDHLRRLLVHPQVGQAVGGALAAYALAIGGYGAGARCSKDSAELGIRAVAGSLPAVFACWASPYVVFPLTDNRLAEIVAEIAERRAAAGTVVPTAPVLSARSVPRADASSPRAAAAD